MEKNRFLALHFEMTNKCNLRCKHCYNIDYLNSNCEDLTTDQIKRIIDKSIELGCQDIGFSGGEPFMRSDIIELLEYSREYPIHVLTNGLLLDSNMIKKLNGIDNLIIEFRISLDGLETHKMLRNIDYKKVLENIKGLLKNEYVVTINTMITNFNLDELLDMYDLFKEIGIDRWRLDFIFNSGNAALNELYYKDKDKLFKTIKRLIKTYIKERPDFIMDINKVFRSSFLDGYSQIYYTLESNPCEYQGSLTVRPNGNVSFCPSLEKTYGNILKDNIDDIVNSEGWKEFSNIKVKDLDKKCLDCKYVKYCGGGCRADGYYETKSLYGISDFTCDLVEFYVKEIIPLIENENSNNKK